MVNANVVSEDGDKDGMDRTVQEGTSSKNMSWGWIIHRIHTMLLLLVWMRKLVKNEEVMVVKKVK